MPVHAPVRKIGAAGLLLLAVAAGGRTAGSAEPPFRSLFDGQTLAGWEGNFEVFRVEDGAIVGGSLDATLPHNEFLCTTSHFEDFELRLQAKLVGPGDNAGIQFRTHRVPGHAYEVSGYQADMGSINSLVLARMSGREATDAERADPTRRSPIWGHLYDESRRNRFLAGGSEEEVRAVLKKEDWNEFVIRAQGPRIQIWLNGLQTVDYVEEDEGIARSGAICLQIHSAGPARASYRAIAIRELPGPVNAPVGAHRGPSEPLGSRRLDTVTSQPSLKPCRNAVRAADMQERLDGHRRTIFEHVLMTRSCDPTTAGPRRDPAW